MFSILIDNDRAILASAKEMEMEGFFANCLEILRKQGLAVFLLSWRKGPWIFP